jgi:hypothetical protein
MQINGHILAPVAFAWAFNPLSPTVGLEPVESPQGKEEIRNQKLESV